MVLLAYTRYAKNRVRALTPNLSILSFDYQITKQTLEQYNAYKTVCVLYISRINGKIRFREKYFHENRMKRYKGGDRWHITHAYIINKHIDHMEP